VKAQRTALFLACVLLFGIGNAQAANSATAWVSDSSVSPEETTELSIHLSGNPGLAAWMFELSWDTNAFTLDTGNGLAQVGDAFSTGTLLAHQKEDSSLTVSWYSARNVSADGEIFTIKLKANSNASGSYPVNITCSAENTINAAEQLVPVSCNNGSITVLGTAQPTPITTPAQETGGGSDSPTPKPSSQTEKPSGTTPAQVENAPESAEEAMLKVAFSDVPQNAYYYDAVQWAVKNGVTNGTGNNSFSPNATCTRAQTVTFLWRAAGSPEPTVQSNPFSDVKADSYYYKAVLWAVAEGVTNGTGADTFSPDATVSRAQTVTFLWRASGSQKAEGTSPFDDLEKDAYYADAVQWAVEHKVTGGTGANTFSPSDSCIRAQIVTFLYRNAAGGKSE